MKKQRLELGRRMFTILLNRERRSRVTIQSRGIVVHLHIEYPLKLGIYNIFTLYVIYK